MLRCPLAFTGRAAYAVELFPSPVSLSRVLSRLGSRHNG